MTTDEFEKRTQEVLEESAARLDGRTRRGSRRRAMPRWSSSRNRRAHWWRSYVPAGAAAAVAVLAVVMWSGPTREPAADRAARRPVEDMELLADADAPDFVDDGEDLEFYEWAAGEVES